MPIAESLFHRYKNRAIPLDNLVMGETYAFISRTDTMPVPNKDGPALTLKLHSGTLGFCTWTDEHSRYIVSEYLEDWYYLEFY
jgi:hypothetical protein